MKTIIGLTIFLLIHFCSSVYSQTEMLKDSRDGKTYKTIKIANRIWMAENINYETKGSFCYENNKANCSKYGGIYSWEIAKKVCPSSWHLPSNDEWMAVTNSLGFREIAGKHMKAIENSFWANPTSQGDNSSGFSAQPGGVYFSDENKFYNAGYEAWFWSSDWDTDKPESGFVRVLFGNKDNVHSDAFGSFANMSVRCVKDIDK